MTRILIVDDHAENRQSLGQYLQGLGFSILYAADGQQAIQQTEEASPDLILMDMHMPVLNGWEATRQIRHKHSQQELPIIALTAYADSSDRAQALEAGCTDHHAKPVQLDLLLKQIHASLALH